MSNPIYFRYAAIAMVVITPVLAFMAVNSNTFAGTAIANQTEEQPPEMEQPAEPEPEIKVEIQEPIELPAEEIEPFGSIPPEAEIEIEPEPQTEPVADCQSIRINPRFRDAENPQYIKSPASAQLQTHDDGSCSIPTYRYWASTDEFELNMSADDGVCIVPKLNDMGGVIEEHPANCPIGVWYSILTADGEVIEP